MKNRKKNNLFNSLWNRNNRARPIHVRYLVVLFIFSLFKSKLNKFFFFYFFPLKMSNEKKTIYIWLNTFIDRFCVYKKKEILWSRSVVNVCLFYRLNTVTHVRTHTNKNMQSLFEQDYKLSFNCFQFVILLKFNLILKKEL